MKQKPVVVAFSCDFVVANPLDKYKNLEWYIKNVLILLIYHHEKELTSETIGRGRAAAAAPFQNAQKQPNAF